MSFPSLFNLGFFDCLVFLPDGHTMKILCKIASNPTTNYSSLICSYFKTVELD